MSAVKVRVFPKENPIFLDRRRKRISTLISAVCIVSTKYNFDRADNCVDEIGDDVDGADHRSRCNLDRGCPWLTTQLQVSQ